MAARRQRLIMYHLSKARTVSIPWLCERLASSLGQESLSSRTLMEDFAEMRLPPPDGYGAPIATKKGEAFFTQPYEPPTPVLHGDDLALAIDALHMITQYKWAHLGPLGQMLVRLGEQGYGPDEQSGLAQVLIRANAMLKGQEWVYPVIECLHQGHCLRVCYAPFDEAVIRGVFRPYQIREYNNRWFVLCTDTQGKDMVFAFDRVESLEICDEGLPACPEHLALLHDQVVGVSVPYNGSLEKVLLRVSPLQIPYEVTKPIHLSQTIDYDENGHALLGLDVIPNYELEMEILQRGEQMEVIEPQWLRQRLAARLESALNRYRYG